MRVQYEKIRSVLRSGLVIVCSSIILTFGSYLIVTGRDVPLGPTFESTSLTGQYLVPLPCGVDGYVSNNPTLPSSRGLPLNYHYWDPCDGNQILRRPFLIDLGFWFIVSAILYIALLAYRRREQIKTNP